MISTMKTALTGLLVGFIHQYMAVVGIQIRHLCFGKYGGCTFQSYVEPSVAGGIWQLMMSQDIVRKAEKILGSKKIPENGDSLVQAKLQDSVQHALVFTKVRTSSNASLLSLTPISNWASATWNFNPNKEEYLRSRKTFNEALK
ncbi:hypothetical protein DFH05DRAFT_1560112 [Lentinula detonsa]|uniref:Uncharacterized protein n=1 Tax=Lentinula detonsa TaxID=2804962 RepID=A0A9W8NS01_9AGAR|nr:hypothetical protein DFH05DRAFT_1560112 [Lentinula detonsa]